MTFLSVLGVIITLGIIYEPAIAQNFGNPVQLFSLGTVRLTTTMPVSGTVAATESGTWTVQPGNTANTTAWKVDGSAVTQPVSGTFWQATQPVSGTFWQATQPVSIATAPALVASSALIGYVGNKWTFGSKVTLTTTNFTSLANGSGWQSVGIASTGRDAILRIQTKGQASGTNYIDIYVCVSISSDTTYSDGCTGTEGTYTAAGRLNSRYLGSVKMNANTTAVQAAFNLTDIFATLPGKFAFIIVNNSGAAISATAGDSVFDYELVN